jgi:uncharacterized membrane protein
MQKTFIDSDQIHVVQNRYRQRTEHYLEPAWATIDLLKPEISWPAKKLLLRSRKQAVELGAFLTENEKPSLVKHLSKALSSHTAW